MKIGCVSLKLNDIKSSYLQAKSLFLSIIAPLHVNSSPCKSCAKSGKDNVISLLQFIFKVPDTQGKGSRTGIAVVLDINHHLFMRNFQPMSYRINNTKVCLMRNNPINSIFIQSIAFCNLSTDIRHVGNSIFKNRPPFLIDVMHVIVNRKIRRSAHRTTSFHMQEWQAFTICPQNCIHNADLLSSRLYHESSCTITEYRTSRTVCIIHHGRHLISPHNNYLLISS